LAYISGSWNFSLKSPIYFRSIAYQENISQQQLDRYWIEAVGATASGRLPEGFSIAGSYEKIDGEWNILI